MSLAPLALSAGEGFERYRVIISKRPFGDEPPKAEMVQVSSSQSFARNLRLSMLFKGPSGDVRAGIIDSALKKTYILQVGQSEAGIELLDADLDAGEATLRKGNETSILSMKKDSSPTPAKTKAPSKGSSYAARRKALMTKIEKRKAKEAPAQPQLTGDALRVHLENVQMDAIRKGLPPLPLPLTPAMDAQLVSEGVLEP
jgi:hypothetical protein